MSRTRYVEARRARHEALAPVTYPAELPITEHCREIGDLLRKHQVVVVAGETGSGKTTQLPKLCLEAGFGVNGMIGHTQPRRLAARAVARRIADELGVELGREVGYAVRFSDRTADGTLVKLMTDGLLLSEVRSDKRLEAYEVIIVDEAHERSLNIDFLLGYLKQLTRRRKDLRVIITSATIDVDAFAQHYDDAPVVEVGGRSYPVEVVYREAENPDQALAETIAETIAEIRRYPVRGAADILTFLAGEREIFDVAHVLRRQLEGQYDVLPLYARLPTAEQQKIFASGGRRRVVLATNVAETSLTVPNIGFVIDPGTARISRYSYRSKLQRLPIERVSRASADQRKGRCGRIAPGVCFRLYSQADFDSRELYTDPEIRRTNLASVMLSMRAFGLGEIERFPFLDPPDPAAVRDATRLLVELGALEQGKLTAIGRRMARLPIDPRLARMLIEAEKRGSLKELLIITSGLAVADPRGRPLEHQAAADGKHAEFFDERSDFLAFVNLWNWFDEQRQAASRSAMERMLKARFLSPQRMREWRELHRQLLVTVRELKMSINTEPAAYSNIHRAVITGCLSLVGLKDQKGEYLGARNLKFRIFPGSSLRKKAPKWLAAAEIAETQRVYARCVADVDPRWIEDAAPHLVKRNHFEPHWHARRGEVVAFERVLLYGLPLVEKRRVAFKRVDAALAHEIFVRDALVAGVVKTDGGFLSHNLNLIREAHDREAKERRRDLLVSDAALAEFYSARVPAEVCDTRSFERWRKRAEASDPGILFMTPADVLARLEESTPERDFPGVIVLDGVEFELKYSFAPGTDEDGLCLQVPLGLLAHVRPEPLEWMVPGFLAPRCEAMVKTLPKSLRRRLAPVPDTIMELAPRLLREDTYRRGRLARALADAIEVSFRLPIQANDWDLERVPAHLRMNVQVRDDRGKLLDQDRDLEALKERLGERGRQVLDGGVRDGFEARGLKEFPGAGVPETHLVGAGSAQVMLYPALADRGDSVDLVLAEDPRTQAALNVGGLSRLVIIKESKGARFMRRELKSRPTMGLHYAALGGAEALTDGLLRASAWRCFFADRALPRTREVFDERVATHRGEWMGVFNDLVEKSEAALARRFDIVRLLDEQTSPAFAPAVEDMRRQLERLMPADFLERTAAEHLAELPRYLNAVRFRLDHLQGRVGRDAEIVDEIRPFEDRYDAVVNQLGSTAAVEAVRFAIEELRVARFAQKLGTREKTSPKRLERLIRPLEEDAGIR